MSLRTKPYTNFIPVPNCIVVPMTPLILQIPRAARDNHSLLRAACEKTPLRFPSAQHDELKSLLLDLTSLSAVAHITVHDGRLLNGFTIAQV